MQWTRFGMVMAATYLAGGPPTRGALGYCAPLLRLEAEILLADGDIASAQPRAEEALVAALELGAPPEIGHCHRLLARVSPSSEHAASARRIFDELGMAFWSARV